MQDDAAETIARPSRDSGGLGRRPGGTASSLRAPIMAIVAVMPTQIHACRSQSTTAQQAWLQVGHGQSHTAAWEAHPANVMLRKAESAP